jgi:hypothetical protein
MNEDNSSEEYLYEDTLDVDDDIYYNNDDTYIDDDIVLPSNFEDMDIDRLTKSLNDILSSLTNKEQCSSEEIEKIKEKYVAICEENDSIIIKSPLLKELMNIIDNYFQNTHDVINENYENELKTYEKLSGEYDNWVRIGFENSCIVRDLKTKLFECEENLKKYIFQTEGFKLNF